jgi:hypothetical protein
VTPSAEWGEVGNGRSRDSDGKPTPVKGGNNSDYLVRRLKRDAPEIAKRLAKGEFPSVRAAAIEAGIVKDLSGQQLVRP